MPEHTSILNILLTSIFIGFGVVVPIVALLKTSNIEKLKVKELFILTAVQAVRVGGILYFLLFLVDTYLNWNYVKLYGDQWLYYWFSPLMSLLLSQLFWIKKLYMKKPALITLALFLLIFPSQRLLLMLRNLHRNYLPATWSVFQMNPLIELLLNIIVFIFIIITIMLAGGKLKKIKE